MIELVVVLAISYLLGSIPTSIIVAKKLRGIDIRQHGSGNAGGTNVFRVLGWKPGLFVMLVDAFKGFIAAYWVSGLAFGTTGMDDSTVQLIAGCAAVFGHIWTLFAGFRGGKGVGTSAGMLLALYPQTLLICLAIFALVFAATRIVSIGSMTAAVAFPVVLSIQRFYFHQPVNSVLYGFSFFAAALILYTHRSNIKRLVSGTENRFKRSSSQK
ncbi:glycerol-3-phosphate 1-O-acyltransferase PlsY [candidate division KSB1 bacterium]|nr:glycerol-3-phosphate 1-O-acyltransferase PlsY [candidate division KSB1 bacterium]